jgi:hypothetical protein
VGWALIAACLAYSTVVLGPDSAISRIPAAILGVSAVAIAYYANSKPSFWIPLGIFAALVAIGPLGLALTTYCALRQAGQSRPFVYLSGLLAAIASLIIWHRTLLFFTYESSLWDSVSAWFAAMRREVPMMPSDGQVGLALASLGTLPILWGVRPNFAGSGLRRTILRGALFLVILASTAWTLLGGPTWVAIAIATLALYSGPRTEAVMARKPFAIALAATSLTVALAAVACSRPANVAPFRHVGFIRSGMGSIEPVALNVRNPQPSVHNYVLMTEASGSQVTLANSVAEAVNAGCDTIYVINALVEPSTQESEAAEQFVRNGGNLIVMGDHTNIGGVMAPTNGYLKGSGLHLRFDSAIPFDPSWRWRDKGRLSTLLFRDEPSFQTALGTSIGASLDVPLDADVLLIGENAFSDTGNPLYGVSRLGNEAPDPKEKKGGLILVARKRLGRGCVIAFGDTSAFQGSSASRSHAYMTDHLERLASAPALSNTRILGLLCALLMVVACLTLNNPAAVAGLVLILLANKALLPGRTIVYNPSQAATVDFSHVPVSLLRDKERNFEALGHLFNNHGLALSYGNVDDARQPLPKVVFLPASAVPYGEETVKRVLDAVSQGSRLIISAGSDQSSCFANFSIAIGMKWGDSRAGSAHEVKILDPVLAEKIKSLQKVNFKESWAILPTGPEWNVLSTCWGMDLVCERRWGKGAIVVVGDTRFFETGNLATDQYVAEANVDFVERMLSL